jgi:hypothetical protein
VAAEQTKAIRKAHTVYTTTTGLRVPGVTTILGLRAKNLTEWAFKMGQQYPELNSIRDHVDDLASIGSLIHYYIECKLTGKAPDLDDWTPNDVKAAAGAMAKFDAWQATKSFTLIASEKKMVSDTWLFGGTIDIFAVVDGKRALCDIKTSKAI